MPRRAESPPVPANVSVYRANVERLQEELRRVDPLAGGRYVRDFLREYSHRAPFSGQAGDPECSHAPDTPFVDVNALWDGIDEYYLAVPLAGGVEGGFGTSSLGVPRTRPEDSPTDLVTTCP